MDEGVDGGIAETAPDKQTVVWRVEDHGGAAARIWTTPHGVEAHPRRGRIRERERPEIVAKRGEVWFGRPVVELSAVEQHPVGDAVVDHRRPLARGRNGPGGHERGPGAARSGNHHQQAVGESGCDLATEADEAVATRVD